MLRTLSFLQKQGLLAVVFVFSSLLVVAQNFPVKWQTSLGHVDSILCAFATGSDGRIYAAGGTGYRESNPSYNNSAKVSSLNGKGEILWEKSFEELKSKRVKAIIPAESSVFTLGMSGSTTGYFSENLGGYDAWVTKFDHNGNISNLKLYGTNTTQDYFNGGMISASGSLIAAGERRVSSKYSYLPVLAKIDTANLSAEWYQEYELFGAGAKTIFWVSSGDTVSRSESNLSAAFDCVVELPSGDFLAGGKAYALDTLVGQGLVTLLSPEGVVKWIRLIKEDGVVNPAEDEWFHDFNTIIGMHDVGDGVIIVGNCLREVSQNDPWISLVAPTDILITKISYNGGYIWQKKIGGSVRDYAHQSFKKSANSILIASVTESRNGDINYRIQNPSAQSSDSGDMWFLELDKSGNIVSRLCFGGNSVDLGLGISSLPSGDLIIQGVTASQDGTFSGLQPDWFQHIIARVVPAAGEVSGVGFVDTNEDGVYQPGERRISYFKSHIVLNGDTLMTTSPNANGIFSVELAAGNYQCVIQKVSDYFLPQVSEVSVAVNGLVAPDTIFIPFRETPQISDLLVYFVTSPFARPGFGYGFSASVKNRGTVAAGDSLRIVLDHRRTDVPTKPIGSFLRGDTLIVPISPLQPGEDRMYDFGVSLAPPPQLSIGDTLQFKAEVFPITNDVTPSNNQFTLKQLVTGSYDPNDKTESHAGVLTQEEIDRGEYLNYLIRFQNTGTDTAFTVVIRDTLEARLDVSSFEMIAASHDYNLSILNGNQLAWTFNNINLADSNVNEPASHGYVQFRIRPFPTLAPGDTIKNSASIYFDYNLPVLTNTEKTTLVIPGALPVKLLNFSAVRKGSLNEIVWQTAEEQQVERFTIERSLNRLDYVAIGSVKAKGIPASYTFSETAPVVPIVYYRLKVVDTDGSIQYSPVVALRGNSAFSATIFPNPITGDASIEINTASAHALQWSIRDMEGRLRKTGALQLNTGTSIRSLPTAALEPGMFIISLKGKDAEQNIMIIKK